MHQILSIEKYIYTRLSEVHTFFPFKFRSQNFSAFYRIYHMSEVHSILLSRGLKNQMVVERSTTIQEKLLDEKV